MKSIAKCLPYFILLLTFSNAYSQCNVGGAVVSSIVHDPYYGNVYYLDNGYAKLGIGLEWGGAIVHISAPGAGITNMVCNYDHGMQLVPDVYLPPNYFSKNGNYPDDKYTFGRYNVTLAGDWTFNTSNIESFTAIPDGVKIVMKPLLWNFTNMISEMKFVCYYTLKGRKVDARYEVINNRTDFTDFGFNNKGLFGIAAFLTGDYHDFYTYNGGSPGTNGPVSQIPLVPSNGLATGSSNTTEHWAALMNDAPIPFGLAMYTPNSDYSHADALNPYSNSTIEYANDFAVMEPADEFVITNGDTAVRNVSYILGTLAEIRSCINNDLNDRQAPTITTTRSIICNNIPGSNVTLTATGCPSGSTVEWSNGRTGNQITVTKQSIYSANCKSSNGVLGWESNEIGIHTKYELHQSDPLVLCSGTTNLSGDFWDQSFYPAISFNWSGTFNGPSPNGNSLLNQGNGTYQCTYSQNGCDLIPSNPVTISNNISIIASRPYLCNNDVRTHLKVEGCQGTVRWSTGETQPEIVVTNTGLYTAYCDCGSGAQTASASINIGFQTNCNSCPTVMIPTITSSSTVACISSPVTVNVTSNPNNYIVEWNNGQNGNSITVTDAGIVSCRFRDPSGCLSNVCSAIIFTSCSSCTAPSAPTLSSSASTACSTDQVTLTAAGCSGGTITWTGGSTGSTKVVTGPGTYSASCIVSNCSSPLANIVINNGSGCASIINAASSCVNNVMTVSVSGSISGSTTPYTVKLVSSLGQIMATNTGNSFPINLSPPMNYLNGTYTITVTDANNNTTTTTVNLVACQPAPGCDLTVLGVTESCSGTVQTLALNLHSSFANLSPFIVDIKDGSNGNVYYNNNQQITYVPYPITVSPSYNGAVNFTITDNRGCVATYSQVLNMCLTTSVKSAASITDLFEIYPNPINEDYFILSNKLVAGTSFSIDIIDIVGKTILTQQLVSELNSQKVALPQLANGCYFLKINHNSTYKIVKINIIK